MNYNDLTIESVTQLTNEELKDYLSNAVTSLSDENGRHLVFGSEDEAIIYSAQLQRNIPSIRFSKIIPAYSNVVGRFFIVEPMVTEYSQKNFTNENQYQTAEDFVLVNEVILMAITENAKREKAKYEAEQTELAAKMEN
jgi:hypothetical protein